MGREIISPKYKHFGDFSLGTALINKDGEWGFIDTVGRAKANPPVIGELEPFSRGLAWVKKDSIYSLIDTQGKEIISRSYDKVWNFFHGIGHV